MEHVVFFPGLDGLPAFRRFAVLDDAVRFVEHLRNVEGVSEVSLHALTEVPLAFRAYYKVEVPGAADQAVVDAAVVDVPAPMVAQDDVPVEGMVDAPLVEASAASPNGKRSMGFFAH